MHAPDMPGVKWMVFSINICIDNLIDSAMRHVSGVRKICISATFGGSQLLNIVCGLVGCLQVVLKLMA